MQQYEKTISAITLLVKYLYSLTEQQYLSFGLLYIVRDEDYYVD